MANQRPCVIYLHCNSGSRIEGLGYSEYILKNGINYFSFDFSGCGNSDGEYISLGVHEAEDLEIIIKFLKEKFYVKQIVLWGRSMGAVTALKYASSDHTIKGIICDSPFSSLQKLAIELGEVKTSLPRIILNPILKIVEQTIKEKADFEFKDLDMINYAKNSQVPCVFVTSKDDQFVSSEHVETLYKNYLGKKKILYAEGDHNTERSAEFLNRILNHILNIFFSKKHLSYDKIINKNIISKEKNQVLYENFANPLREDKEKLENINLKNILETNKELAKKIVLNNKNQQYSRLDTEVLYEDFHEVNKSYNKNNMSVSSAYQLKDKMQSLIHNSTLNDSKNRIKKATIFGNFDNFNDPVKSSNENLGILRNFNPKFSYSQPKNNFSNVTSEIMNNSSHVQKNRSENELDLKNYKKLIQDEYQPQIKINNISYSNPVELKKENYGLHEAKQYLIPINHIRNQSNDNLYSLSSRNKQIL